MDLVLQHSSPRQVGHRFTPYSCIEMWPATRKGTSWTYSEIHLFRVLNRVFNDESKNINMLVGSWSFWVSKCPKKMGTALKRHKLSIDLIVMLHIFERKLKNAINKIYLFAKVSYFLKNCKILENEFSLTSTGTSQSHDVKDFFSQTYVHLLHYQLNVFSKY